MIERRLTVTNLTRRKKPPLKWQRKRKETVLPVLADSVETPVNPVRASEIFGAWIQNLVKMLVHDHLE